MKMFRRTDGEAQAPGKEFPGDVPTTVSLLRNVLRIILTDLRKWLQSLSVRIGVGSMINESDKNLRKTSGRF